MSSQAETSALYLRVDGLAPVFAVLHTPAAGGRRDTAVLICPPFGWDDVCSYRSRRDWAGQLAAAGHAALRIDLPGTGDSGGGPEDPGLLDAWTEAVSAAALWLSGAAGTRRVAAIGIGLGGLLACRALAQGAQIDDLVLWAVPSRGAAFVRELRAFGKMEASRYRPPTPALERPAPADGATSAGGFLLSAETTGELEQLDLLELTIPERRGRRVLMLERDGIGVDERLADHLRESADDLSVSPGAGYSAMMAEPQEARPPSDVFAHVESWLGGAGSGSEAHERTGPRERPAQPLIEARGSAEMTVAGTRIRETPIVVEQPFGLMSGVLAEPLERPAGRLGAIFLNAGAIRRIGPNRMWVEISRRWAARGVTSLRVDLEGLGDSDGNAERFSDVAELYVPEFFDQARGAIDHLQARCGAQEFVLVGLCSGAFWSFHGALRDERVVAAFMVNPRTLFWDATQETLRYLRRGLLLPSSWRLIARGHVRPARIGAVLRRAPGAALTRVRSRRAGLRRDDALIGALNELSAAGTRLLFVFSEGEPLHEELARRGPLRRPERWPNVRLELIPGPDHTLRPRYSRRHAEQALDAALGELVSTSGEHPPS